MGEFFEKISFVKLALLSDPLGTLVPFLFNDTLPCLDYFRRMRVIRSPQLIQQHCLSLKKQGHLALIPTMGALHDGHLSLMRLARKQADFVVATIFVNPLQFGQNEDLSRYPHDEKNDLKKLRGAGVDFVFMPKSKDMYPENFQTHVDVEAVTQSLCGASRPGHFCGVATGVLKLFNLIQPDVAIFGKKDFQQLVTIQTMARDLNLPIRVMGASIVREPDGLALSSRNVYLNSEQRADAIFIRRALLYIQKTARTKNLMASQIRSLFSKILPDKKSIQIDYVSCVDRATLQPLTQIKKNHTLIAVAVFLGKTRLIDNIEM
jgi:pantoate--beta-alanine ligase